MNISKVMAFSPHLEVFIRKAYWRFPSVVNYYNRHKKIKKTNIPSISSSSLIDQLSNAGIKRGDLLILHTSFKTLRAAKETPSQIIDRLIDFLGNSGTLALPAIPLFTEGPEISERMTADLSDLVLDYCPKTTPSWTGALPNELIKYKEAIRSLHPLNSMVAIGPLAEPMMERNIEGDLPLACGINSAWYFCYKRNAKVIAIGADLAHSLTMIHVAEDMWAENWVVPNWYRKRKFRVLTNKSIINLIVRERKPHWAQHYAERTLSKDLIKLKITNKFKKDGVNFEILNSKDLIDYLNSRNHTGYPYYFVPVRKGQNPRDNKA